MPLDLEEGAVLPGISRSITQAKINRYAEASGDFNPIHVDEEFARRTPLGGTVAHGMMVLAYASQVMEAAFGHDWLSTGRLDVRFRAPARPGDTISVSAKVTGIERGDGHSRVSCAVLCQNQQGDAVITGLAEVRLTDR